MITFFEWLLLVSLGAAFVWQFIWMVLLDRWIQKWAEAEKEKSSGEV